MAQTSDNARPLWGGGGQYQAWADFLERWAAGEPADPTTLPPIAVSDFAGDGLARLSNRFTGALSRRLGSWAESLSRACAAETDEFAVARALAQARAGLLPIRALATHPGLPADFGARAKDMVDRTIRSAQDSLERQVESMLRAGYPANAVDARRRTVRDNSLTATIRACGDKPVDGWYVDPDAPRRRRVITD